MSPFYITTPIYYVNALPHLGTFYATVLADAVARYQRARRGRENVFFLTGVDEHGQKIERIARERGMDPQTYCDGIAARFEETWKAFGITNDDFLRTTQPRHQAAVAEMWQRLRHDIYESEYDGMYCVGCEEFKSDDDVTVDGDRKLCKIHLTPIERVKEKNYFFRLSAYTDKLLAWYETNPVRPESRLNEVRSFVRSGLRDFSVSRSNVKWGIPVPGDPAQTIYVWVDALINYLTALGGPGAVARGEGKGALWAESHHLLSKDILRFHAVYWPAMLMSAGLPPPKQVLCHGYLTVKGQKISKSMPATRIDPRAIADDLGVDPLRYFVLREYAFGGDGDFTYEALFQRYESDLGNDLGNLLNRTISMARRYDRVEALRKPHEHDALAADAGAIAAEVARSWENVEPSRALEAVWGLLREMNRYVDAQKPWVLAKSDIDKLDKVLATCCEAIRWAALMIAPATPAASGEILRQLGRSEDEGTWPSTLGWPGGTVTEPTPVFPRVEPDRQAALIAKWVPPEAATAAPPPRAPAAAPPADVVIDDFAKIDLRAAKVLAAERVPKADKLLKLTLDIGAAEPRTVVSGIAPAYSPETIVGRTVIYFANLAPRKIRGVVSQGMILAAGDEEVLGLSALDKEVAPGTKIR
ncbi:MAG TPA: methionine--tRNA ligase [Polyangia bacterium]|nr:methionine--tRNA ligase [Polyangia bacterium]